MRQAILDKFYQPTLYFFLLPLLQILLGITFSIQYQSINVLACIFLYLFILCNQMLENILLRIPNSDFEFSKGFFMTFELLNVLTILYFGFQFSWIAGLVLLLFSLNIQGQFLFSYYNLELFAAIISAVLKILFLNGFSFYIGAGFIQLQSTLYFAGLILPFLLYEIARVHPEMSKKTTITIVSSSYLIGVLLLWSPLNLVSLLLFVSLPFAWGLIKDTFNRKNTSVFMINFSIIYILLIIYSVFVA